MKHGCHNRPPLKTVVVVQDGWIVQPGTRAPRMIAINDPMSKDCQYTLHDKYNDQKCIGCAHHRGNRPATQKEDSHERTNTTK